MAFEACTQLWGTAEINQSNPIVTCFHDVIYFPFSDTVFFDRDSQWGIYDKSGYLIKEAAYTRGPEENLVGQSQYRVIDPNDKISDAPCDTYIYGGLFIPHYGHFLITSLARLWGFIYEKAEDTNVLFHSTHESGDHFKINYSGMLLRSLGLSPANVIRFREPTRIKNLVVPSRSFLEQKSAYHVYADLCRLIGSRLLGSEVQCSNDTPVYMSKTKLPIGVAKIVNEQEIEEALRNKGFDIVYPEQLSIKEQIDLFMTRTRIVGSAGSGFHTHIFVPNPPKMLCIHYKNILNSNFVMLDKLNDANVNHVYSANNFEDAACADYLTSYFVRAPEQFVADIIRLVDNGKNKQAGIQRILYSEKGNDVSLYSYFLNNKGPEIHKNLHYFPIYERHFGHMVGRPLVFYEIGTWKGGSARMWKEYFGPLAQIVTIDINPDCKAFEDAQIKVRIGDQSDPAFLAQVIAEFGPPDIVLDDGSHMMAHVISSFKFLYPRTAHNGIYLVEDLHTAYWENYGGGLKKPGTFIELCKDFIDELNADYTGGALPPTEFSKSTISMHVYDSIVVFERGKYLTKEFCYQRELTLPSALISIVTSRMLAQSAVGQQLKPGSGRVHRKYCSRSLRPARSTESRRRTAFSPPPGGGLRETIAICPARAKNRSGCPPYRRLQPRPLCQSRRGPRWRRRHSARSAPPDDR